MGVAFFWIAVWFIVALSVKNPLLFPSPAETAKRLFTLASTSEYWVFTLFSLLRVTLGSLSALIAGVLSAVICSRIRLADRLMSPLMTVIKSVPVASFIILALVWLGTAILPAFISFLMVYPLVFTNVKTGIKNVPYDIIEMGHVFHLPKAVMLKQIYIPYVMPYFSSALKSSLGLAWKAGIAAEVLCSPKYSIGRMLFESKTYLETEDLFAWTFTVIVLSLAIELAFGRLIERLYGKKEAAK